MLSALIEDLRQPNPALVGAARKPLIERNPVGFWRTIAVLMIAINILLIYRIYH